MPRYESLAGYMVRITGGSNPSTLGTQEKITKTSPQQLTLTPMSIRSRLKQLAIKLFDIKELDYPHRYLAMKHPEELEKAKKMDKYWLGILLTTHHLKIIDNLLDSDVGL